MILSHNSEEEDEVDVNPLKTARTRDIEKVVQLSKDLMKLNAEEGQMHLVHLMKVKHEESASGDDIEAVSEFSQT